MVFGLKPSRSSASSQTFWTLAPTVSGVWRLVIVVTVPEVALPPSS